MKNLKFHLIVLIVSSFLIGSCSSDNDDVTDPDDEPIDVYDPIILDCHYFKTDRVLTVNPYSSVDYVITCWMSVDGHIKIEPGVVIEFEEDAGINIYESPSHSSFSAIGTNEEPIIFKGKIARKGYWNGIYFNNATSFENELSHVIVQDAGRIRTSSAESGGVSASGETRLKITNTTFKNNSYYGLNINSRNVYLDEFEQNVFTENDFPVKTHPHNLSAFNESNSFSGNVNDYIYISARYYSIKRNLTWYKADVPYLLARNNVDLHINAHVVMNAGVEVIMTRNSSIRVGHHNTDTDDYIGSLVMNGTANDEIIFRGEEATPGYWKHIRYLNKDDQNKMSHVRLINAGSRLVNETNGALLLHTEAILSLDHVTFENCYDFGISLRNRSKNSFPHSNLSFPGTPREFGDYNNVPLN